MKANRLPWALLSLLALAGAGPASQPANLSSMVVKPDAPEAIKQWWALQPSLRAASRSDLTARAAAAAKELAAVQVGRVTGETSRNTLKSGKVQYTFSASATKKEHIATMTEKLATAKAAIGNLDGQYLFPGTPFQVGSVVAISRFHVQQVIDARSMRIRLGQSDLWLDNVDTSKFMDDADFVFNPQLPVLCERTKTYGTAIGGQKTVPLLTGFDPMDYLVAK